MLNLSIAFNASDSNSSKVLKTILGLSSTSRTSSCSSNIETTRESMVGFKPNKNYGKSLEKVRKEREERVGLLVMPWCMWRVDSNGDEAPPVLRREWKEDAKRRLGLAGEVECYWEEKCILVHLVFPMMCRKQQRMQEANSVSFNTYSDWVCSVKMM